MKNIFYTLLILSILSSCSSDNVGNNNPPGDGFDRGAMLDNIVSNIIIPSHEDLLLHLNELDSSVSNFVNNTNSSTLQDVREKWLSAYKIYQHVEVVSATEIGEQIFYGTKMNSFPTKNSLIDLYVNMGSWDLENNSQLFQAQGFPALDYLLYGLESDSNDIINNYTDGSNHLLFLQDVIDVMITNTETVINSWKSDKASYISSDGSSQTSSTDVLLNNFSYYYEKDFRTYKFGLPLGIWVDDVKRPEKLEAFYNGVSQKILALEALTAIEKFFSGTSYDSQSQGESFKTYLQYLGEDNLVSNIEGNFTNARNMINILGKSFINEVNLCSGVTKDDYEAGYAQCNMFDAWYSIQVNVAEFKIDMFNAFGVGLTYSSGDGD